MGTRVQPTVEGQRWHIGLLARLLLSSPISDRTGELGGSRWSLRKYFLGSQEMNKIKKNRTLCLGLHMNKLFKWKDKAAALKVIKSLHKCGLRDLTQPCIIIRLKGLLPLCKCRNWEMKPQSQEFGCKTNTALLVWNPLLRRWWSVSIKRTQTPTLWSWPKTSTKAIPALWVGWWVHIGEMHVEEKVADTAQMGGNGMFRWLSG